MNPVEYQPRFKWQTYDGGAGHRVPEFRASMAAMKNFSDFVEFIESTGAHLQSGVVKVIPPTEWLENSFGKMRYGRLADYKLPRLLYGEIQIPADSEPGIYNLENELEDVPVPLREYVHLASGPERLPPHIETIEEFEKYFWEKLKTSNKNKEKIIYGADVPGSLFSKGITEWNLGHLDSILNRLKEEKIDGVNSPYLYFGTGGSAFPFHIEDKDLYSINFHHMGEPKFWYAIPSHAATRFESLVAQLYPDFSWNCPQFIRHKICIIDPAVLEKYGIPYGKVAQYPGEFIITFPRGYHQGFNAGFNCAEAVNFALPRWIHYGSVARICDCNEGMAVRLNMGNFYDLVKDQENKKLRLPALEIAQKQPELNFECVKAQKAMEKLRILWSSFEAERLQNKKMAMKAPFCSVCQPFSKSRLRVAEEIPNSSMTLIKSKAFTKADPKGAEGNAKYIDSPLRQCKTCGVCVHEFCYTGSCRQAKSDSIPQPSTSSTIDSPFEPELEEEQPKVRHYKKRSQWECDRCSEQKDQPEYRRKICCDFCSLRSGALIEHRRQLYRDGEAPASTHRTYVHILCAMASRSTSILKEKESGKLVAHSLPPAREFSAIDSNGDGFPLATFGNKVIAKKYVLLDRNHFAGHFNDRFCTLCDEQMVDVVAKCWDCNEEGRHSLPYHASCAALAGFLFLNANFPRVLTFQCPVHRNPEARRKSIKDEERSELEYEPIRSKTPSASRKSKQSQREEPPAAKILAKKPKLDSTPKTPKPKATPKPKEPKSESKSRKRPLPKPVEPRVEEPESAGPVPAEPNQPEVSTSDCRPVEPNPLSQPSVSAPLTLELQAMTQFPVTINVPDRFKPAFIAAATVPATLVTTEPTPSTSADPIEFAELVVEEPAMKPIPPLLSLVDFDTKPESAETQPSPPESNAQTFESAGSDFQSAPTPTEDPNLEIIPASEPQPTEPVSSPEPQQIPSIQNKSEFDFYSGFF